MPIAALRFRRMQAGKHRGFGMIQIWKAELGFPPSQFPSLAFAPHGRPPPDGWPLRMRQPWWLGDGIAVYPDSTGMFFLSPRIPGGRSACPTPARCSGAEGDRWGCLSPRVSDPGLLRLVRPRACKIRTLASHGTP